MIPETRKNIVFLVSWLVLFISTFFITRLSQSQHFIEVVIFYTFSFVAYLSLLKYAHLFSKRSLYIGSLILMAICFLHLPYLSNDYFRFLWDGEIMHLGINPYDFTPNQLIQKLSFSDCYYLDLYAGMGELSQSNYSCYPTINQGYFYLSTLFSNDIATNIFILRLLIVVTIAVSAYYIEKLLIHFGFNVKRIFILLLNPLVLIECISNLHFELTMVAFVLMALYFLIKDKLIISSILFAFAVHVKLIPLLILPFLLSYLGWRRAFRYYTLTGISIILLFLIFIDFGNYENFLLSLQLYFSRFEFNSFLLYPYVEYGKAEYGYNLISKYGPQLAKMALLVILGIAWKKRFLTSTEMIERILLGLMVYYFFTSTVHPWYWVLPLGFSLFKFSWSLVLLTFFTTLSYGIYAYDFNPTFRLILAGINGFLLLMYLAEVLKMKRKWNVQMSILN